MLADVSLDEVVGTALLDVNALVAVRTEGVVVDPIVGAHVDIHVVGAAGPDFYLWRLSYTCHREITLICLVIHE